MPDYERAHLVKCQKCSFVFAQRIPTEEELNEHYKGYSRNDYLSPLTVKRYEELLDSWEPYRKNNKILDVGCGVGYFLEIAKQKGWEVYGTEYTDKAVDICSTKGIYMSKGELNVEEYVAESFDIITSFEVIEHINNPVHEIAKFHQLLRRGGILYITTPNFNSTLRYFLKSQYNVVTYPEHLSYYTPKTLSKLLKMGGFQKIWVKTTGVSPTRFMTSVKKQNTGFIAQNSADEIVRKQLESSRGMGLVKITLNFFLTFLGIGDAIKVLFQKAS